MPGPAPRILLRDTSTAAFTEALYVVGRPDVDLGNLGSGSNLSVRWRCARCSHEWDAKAAARSKGTGCPQCAWELRARSRAQAPAGSSLADLFPAIAAEFVDNLERSDMGPEDLRCGSHQRCLWRCGSCGHQWAARVANRVLGRGCPECGRRRRSELLRRPTATTGTAARAAYFPLSEFLANLTHPDLGLEDLRPNSLDRCRWRCSACAFEWEATVTNRVGKRSGCPICAAKRNGEVRGRAPEGESLQALYPDIAAEFVEHLARSDRTPAQIWPGSNAVCRWRCVRGHEWLTTVASRAAGAGCARCLGRGQSRLEFEVAEILRIATGQKVQLDVPVRAVGRTWRLDLALPALDLLVDLDPKHWHGNDCRDQRKIDALTGHVYIRIRPVSLPNLDGLTCPVPDDDFNALTWARALSPTLNHLGASWREPGEQECSAALAAAATRWRETLRGRPIRSALDAEPHLATEFLENLTRPGISPGWISPNARDKCRWRAYCGHEWISSVASRAAQGSGCPVCARVRTNLATRGRSKPGPGKSLLDQHPDLAAEFIRCLSQPDRTTADLRPSSNLMCLWRCPECGSEFRASVAGRTRLRGCRQCALARAGDSRSSVRPDESIAILNPEVAQELVEVLGRPHRTARNTAPGSNLYARWRCASCTHEWVTTVASRALSGHGCPSCARGRTVAARLTPKPGQSLEDQFPQVAAEFVENLTHPGRGPDKVQPGSHDRCRWRGACGHSWTNNVKNRTRLGSGCPDCYRESRRRG